MQGQSVRHRTQKPGSNDHHHSSKNVAAATFFDEWWTGSGRQGTGAGPERIRSGGGAHRLSIFLIVVAGSPHW
jgi:hypothetical protein